MQLILPKKDNNLLSVSIHPCIDALRCYQCIHYYINRIINSLAFMSSCGNQSKHYLHKRATFTTSKSCNNDDNNNSNNINNKDNNNNYNWNNNKMIDSINIRSNGNIKNNKSMNENNDK